MKHIMTPWKRFVSLLQLDKRDIKQLFYYAIFGGLVALSLPLGIQAIINLIQGAQISSSWIVLVVLVTLGVGFQGALQLMQIRILENIQQKIFTRSSFEFAYRFPKIKASEIQDYYPPELANRFFDTLVVQKGLSKILIDFPGAVLQIVLGIMLLSFYHAFFIIYGILLIILIYVVFKFTAQKGLETSLKESKAKYKVAYWLQEVARSLISFKLSGKTNLAMKKNDIFTTDYLEARESHFKILVIQFIQMIGFKILVTAGLLLIGGLLVLNQQMNIGQFVAAEIIILLIINSVEKLIKGLETFYDVLTSLEKIGQIVDKELEAQNGINPFETDTSIHIELENVSYTADDGEEILKDISLSINTGDRIQLQGDSGSGKTTLLKLLTGINIPSTGSIYVNNSSIKGVFLTKYRGEIGQVLPSQQLFRGTILDNITLGDDGVTKDRLHEVLKNLNLLDFIKKQPNGLRQVIDAEGIKIPHTISRKIVLARAIVHEPKLLILKDPLEHFEPEEMKSIIRYVSDVKHSWAIIVASKGALWMDVCKEQYILKNKSLNIISHA